MADVRIIFMGTPEFAVPSLEILVRNKYQVVAVVTAPDKPQGRGQKIAFSPVKECALSHNLPVLQPSNLKSPEFIGQLRSYDAQLQVVVAFRMLPEAVWSMPQIGTFNLHASLLPNYRGAAPINCPINSGQLRSYDAQLQVVVAFRMLPEAVWSMPQIGTFNLHASLLPNYRGAAPINWAIINGEKETGVTTFFLQHEIDTGSIIFQSKEPIHDSDTAGTLYARLMDRGAELVLKTVKGISEGKYNSIPQPKDASVKPAPKIFRETSEINWNQPSQSVRNFVRGLSPYPAAWTTINGKTFKIYQVSTVNHSEVGKVGTFSSDNKNYLYFKTADGWVSADDLQAEGKRRMNTVEFFRGNKLI